MNSLRSAVGALVWSSLLTLPQLVSAQSSLTISNLSYVNWTSFDAVQAQAGGSLVLTNLNLSVQFSGELLSGRDISGGDNFFQPGPTFLSTVISNLPPTSDFVALEGGPNTPLNTLTFSEPVVDPILLIMSLGEENDPAEYQFDRDFVILSQGSGPFNAPGLLQEADNNVLRGLNGWGAIQFPGEVSSISWLAPVAEPWSGFTVGAPNTPTIPDTASPMVLFGLALPALVLLRRRGSPAD